MIALTTKFFASISTLKERLSHHRLIQVFVAVAFAHCLLQAFLQGEALAVSRGGAHLLKEIHEAPKEGLLVLRVSILVYSERGADCLSAARRGSRRFANFLPFDLFFGLFLALKHLHRYF